MRPVWTLAIAFAGIACSMLLDRWIPSWIASLTGLALVLALLWLRRRLTARTDAGTGTDTDRRP